MGVVCEKQCCTKAEKEEAVIVSKSGSAVKDGEDPAKKAKWLGQIPLFKKLNVDMLVSLLKVSQEVKFDAGENVITHGDNSTDLFLIVKGEAEVFLEDGKSCGKKFKVGDYFGETGLLHDKPRTATVKAITGMVTIMVTREGFMDLELEEHLDLVEKNKLIGLKKAETAVLDKKKIKFLKKVSMLQNLDEKTLEKVLLACEEKKASKGDQFIKQGDSGSDLYLIIKGEVNVIVDGKEVAKLKEGDYVGEKGLVQDETRSATCQASAKSLLLKLTRKEFEKLGLEGKLVFADR